MSLIFENKVPSSYRIPFVKKVKEVASRLGINPNWLMAIMYWESARTFSPSITNSLGYTGLIQFGSAAAQDLGTTTAILRSMSAVDQLDYVERYFKLWFKRLKITAPNTYVDTYLIVLFPVAVNKGYNFVIQSGGISAYKFAINNPAFDFNKDNKVTVKEIETKMLEQLPSQEWIKIMLEKKK